MERLSVEKVEKEIARLYGEPLAAFTAARDELARTLRKAGDKAAADKIKALRKPTVSAWAVNQIARKERMKIRSLLVAGETLRNAHTDVLGGGEPAKLREATDAERKVVGHLVSSAADVLAQAGHPASENMLERIATTLRAAAVDDEGRALLEEGRLTRDLDPSGFGPLVALPPQRKQRPSRTGPRGRRRVEAAEQKLHSLRAELRDARGASTAAEERVAAARRDLRDAEKDAHAAEQNRERLERRLAAAERELDELRRP